MVIVKIPSQLRTQTDGLDKVELEGSTVQEVLQKLVEKYSGLRDRIYDEQGNLRRYVNIYLGEEDIRFMDFLDTKLESGSEIALVPAIAGG